MLGKFYKSENEDEQKINRKFKQPRFDKNHKSLSPETYTSFDKFNPQGKIADQLNRSLQPLQPVTQAPVNTIGLENSVRIVEKAWICYRNKQMFRLLKHSLRAAEKSLSYEILRRVSPREAELLMDKSQQVKIRFRFGGEDFPPLIFFKIFLQGSTQKVKYFSGKKMIRPATEAAEGSLRQMGQRSFHDQILRDMLQRHSGQITDQVDVTTLKDYMQYLATLDESPAWQGGKENYWRKLTLEAVPRRTIFFDVVDFAYNKQLTPRLKEEMHVLRLVPVTQEIQRQQIRAISKLRSVEPPGPTPRSQSGTTRCRSEQTTLDTQRSRRSRQAKQRVQRMRQIYSGVSAERSSERNKAPFVSQNTGFLADESDEDFLNSEATQLYQWTQELSFHDDSLQMSLLAV